MVAMMPYRARRDTFILSFYSLLFPYELFVYHVLSRSVKPHSEQQGKSPGLRPGRLRHTSPLFPLFPLAPVHSELPIKPLPMSSRHKPMKFAIARSKQLARFLSS